MNDKEWEQFIYQCVKTFLRTVKPWKKSPIGKVPNDVYLATYAKGWNDCLKEIQKNADRWFKEMPKMIEEKSKTSTT